MDALDSTLSSGKTAVDSAEAAGSGAPLGLRNTMSQLHGNANKLLATRIDAILTSELVSGRDDARAKRKALIKVVEELIEKVEGLVKQFDKARAPFTPAK